jgi:hypothetical protein
MDPIRGPSNACCSDLGQRGGTHLDPVARNCWRYGAAYR